MAPSRPTKLNRSRHAHPTSPVFRAAQAVMTATRTPRAAGTKPTRRTSRSLVVAVAVVVVEASEHHRRGTVGTSTTPPMMPLPAHCATSARRRLTATARGSTRRIIPQHVERWATAFVSMFFLVMGAGRRYSERGQEKCKEERKLKAARVLFSRDLGASVAEHAT